MPRAGKRAALPSGPEATGPLGPLQRWARGGGALASEQNPGEPSRSKRSLPPLPPPGRGRPAPQGLPQDPESCRKGPGWTRSREPAAAPPHTLPVPQLPKPANRCWLIPSPGDERGHGEIGGRDQEGSQCCRAPPRLGTGLPQGGSDARSEMGAKNGGAREGASPTLRAGAAQRAALSRGGKCRRPQRHRAGGRGKGRRSTGTPATGVGQMGGRPQESPQCPRCGEVASPAGWHRPAGETYLRPLLPVARQLPAQPGRGRLASCSGNAANGAGALGVGSREGGAESLGAGLSGRSSAAPSPALRGSTQHLNEEAGCRRTFRQLSGMNSRL